MLMAGGKARLIWDQNVWDQNVWDQNVWDQNVWGKQPVSEAGAKGLRLPRAGALRAKCGSFDYETHKEPCISPLRMTILFSLGFT